ncbi:DNA polymerase III subunit gamma and tau [Actinomycetota bacterium]|nr:DNA polymerase III subunit gamma and tau [Actinomycetota bacterium]
MRGTGVREVWTRGRAGLWTTSALGWVAASRVLGVTTALYRRYRPETFAGVVGQDHVTGPLRQALRSGQVNHAYLFSGPRGCGKTTSARILARCLNCEQGPTDTPCGTCPSCVELARGGSGSLDVVEIDAASHGGVDDARDLRERATFAPARDRYKVFILDEAHMVSPQGFNALLKIVEEPPEHVKFIFATTEPDKVIGTIRSRTHHYPFRLVPPEVLTGYLEEICGTEGVTVGAGVLPLVVRAGGGSVRDSLSVLDQLIAGSGPAGIDYEGAVSLLGYTHASLLDDLVEAVAARDGASAFRVVERVISTGHEPRRFVEDLLERLRDLIVIAASGDSAAAVLRDLPSDQYARMQAQATHLGASELSRSADLTNAALTEMTGATSPRLHLELLMARLLLPAVEDTATGLGARIDRLERGFTVPSTVAPVVVAPVPVSPPATPAPAVPAGAGASAVTDASADARVPADASVPADSPVPVATAAPVPPQRPTPASAGAAQVDHPAGTPAAAAGHEVATGPGPRAATSADVPGSDAAAAAGAGATPAVAADAVEPVAVPAAEAVVPTAPVGSGPDTEMLRRRWAEVLDTLNRLRKATWVLVSQSAQIVDLDATTLRLGFAAPGLATAFRTGPHADLVQRAVRETLGFDVKVESVLSGPDGGGGQAGGSTPGAPGSGGGARVGAHPDAAAGSGGPAAMTAAEAAASWDAPVVARVVAPGPAPTAEPVHVPATAAGRSTGPAADAASTAHVGHGGPRPAGSVDAEGGPDPDAPADPYEATSASTGDGSAPDGPDADPVAPALGHDPDDPGMPEPYDEDPGESAAYVEPHAPEATGPGAATAPRSTAAPSVRPVPPAPAAQRVLSGRELAMSRAHAAPDPHPQPVLEDDSPSPDDPDITSSGLHGAPLVAQILGGIVIDEQIDDGM